MTRPTPTSPPVSRNRPASVSRPQLIAFWLATVASLGSCALGCAPQPALDERDAWHRVDLWREVPEIEFAAANAPGGAPPVSARIGFAGSEEVRDMSKVPEEQLAQFPFRRAAQLRVLEQAVSSRLVWTMDLGFEPFVRFVPLGSEDRPCACQYRFGLRDRFGTLHELWRSEVEAAGRFASAPVEIDLIDFSEAPVELIFQIDPLDPESPVRPVAVPPAARWGSPAVYWREAVVRPLPRRASAPPNVLFIGVDTLRADHVGAQGFAASLTPSIDRLAHSSDVWDGAVSSFNITNPSFASMFTGLYGKNHGIYDLATPLPAGHTTLAERFDEAGYDTLAVISASHLGDHNSGLGQGFDKVTRAPNHFTAELAVEMAMDWIADRPASSDSTGRAPFFAWVHLFDPHTPHTPPAPYAAGFRPSRDFGLAPVRGWLPFRTPGIPDFSEPVLGAHRDLYSGEVAYTDRQIGRLLGFLESRGLDRSTIIVLVADHGENLGEHGIDSRHEGLWQTTLRVPMIVHWPGQREGHRFAGMVQTVDLFPTLLRAAQLEPTASDGIDLQQLTGDGRLGRRAVFAEHAMGTEVMVTSGGFKYLRRLGSGKSPENGTTETLLFDLKTDPAESINLAGRGHPTEQNLSDLLDRWLADRRQDTLETESLDLSDEEISRLKALGYL